MQSCWHWNQTAWVTNEGRLRWFECVECKDDTDWVHCHTTVEGKHRRMMQKEILKVLFCPRECAGFEQVG